MNDTGTLCVFVFALIILAVLTYRMDGETIGLISACVLFFLICRRRMRDGADVSHFDDNNEDGSTENTQESSADATAGSSSGDDGKIPSFDEHPTWVNELWKDQRPPDPVFKTPTDKQEKLIDESNRRAVGEVYGRRYGGTMDNALYVHKQRIGDRQRQAIINQVRGRRNNVYEPYYRQELSEHASKRWWENDDVLVTKLDKRQLSTIDMGRFNLDDADMDGIYDQQ